MIFKFRSGGSYSRLLVLLRPELTASGGGRNPASPRQGYSNKEIASLLDISLETVRTHLRHIYEKLHVHSRTEALARYFED